MKKVFDAFEKGIEVICKIMLLLQVIAVMSVVIGRYFFNVTPVWGEEFTLFSLVWISLIGAMIPLRENKHLRMSIYDKKLSPKALMVMNLFSNCIICFFSVVMLIAGIAQTKASVKTILNGIKISKGWLYLAVPVSMGLFIWILFEKALDSTGKLIKRDRKSCK